MPEIRERTPNALLKSDDDDSLQAEIERWEGEGGSVCHWGRKRSEECLSNARAYLPGPGKHAARH